MKTKSNTQIHINAQIPINGSVEKLDEFLRKLKTTMKELREDNVMLSSEFIMEIDVVSSFGTFQVTLDLR